MFARSHALGLVIAAVVPVALLSRADEPAGKPFEPPVVLSGTHSQIRYEMFKLVTTSRDWKVLWEAHRGKPADQRFTESHQELAVDFEKHVIVAVFAGHCDRCEITSRARGDSVVIGFACFTRSYTPSSSSELPPQPLKAPPPAELYERSREAEKEGAAAPYSFVVLPKTVKSVVIEQSVERELTKPPVWEHRATFSVSDPTR